MLKDSGRKAGRFGLDVQPELLQALDVVALQAVATEPIEVVVTQFLVDTAILQQVIGDDEDRVRNRHGGSFGATPRSQSAELGRQVGPLRVARCPRRLA